MCKLLHVDIEAKSSLSVGVCHRAIVSNAIIGGGGGGGGGWRGVRLVNQMCPS